MSITLPSPPAAAFADALASFEAGEWYVCHDQLEAVWHQSLEPARTPLHALLQIAVAMVHWENGNRRGATLLWAEASARLRRCGDNILGVDLSPLQRQAADWLRFLMDPEAGAAPPPPCLRPPGKAQTGAAAAVDGAAQSP